MDVNLWKDTKLEVFYAFRQTFYKINGILYNIEILEIKRFCKTKNLGGL
jgi:hypothetical protein